jgi:hypothetical protein
MRIAGGAVSAAKAAETIPRNRRQQRDFEVMIRGGKAEAIAD